MSDYIVRATAAGGTVRAFAAVTTDMVQEAKKVHSLSPLSSVALGRTMTAAAIMSKIRLKGEDDRVTVQIKGDGPLGGIIVASDVDANVRGYVYNPETYLPLNSEGKFDVAGAVGRSGYMNVIMDLGLKEPYIGYVRLVSGEIAEDIAYYFAKSEQVPSIVALGVLIDKDETVLNAGGFIVQLMPDADDELIEYLENKIGSIPSITKLLSDGKSPEDILEILLGEKSLKIIDTVPCRFACNCSRERMERNLISLGKKELYDLIENQHGAELQCHFCNSTYQFSEQELLDLINDQQPADE